MKACNKCKEEKELSEFYKNKSKKDGLSRECKECTKRRDKQYYQVNKEQIAERTKQYYQANKEKFAEYGKQHYQANKEKIAERKKQWYQANKEKIAEYHQANKEQIAEYRKQYNQAEPAAVYEIRNKLNGKVYIGQSTRYPTRKAQHRRLLKKGTHENTLLQLDYSRHGEDAFEYSMVREFQCDAPKEFLMEQESIEMAIRVQRGETLYNSQLPSTELLKCDLELLESAITEFEHPIDHLQMIIETCNSQNVPLQLGLLALKQIKERE